jgi:hypothetical protein
MTALVTAVVTLFTRAILGFLPTYIMDRRLEKRTARTRWDSALFESAEKLIAATRRSQHLSGQVASGHNDPDRLGRLDEEQQAIRVAAEQNRLVANGEVQLAAREILQHVYALRVQAEKGEDPYVTQYGERQPVDRLRTAHLDFYRAVRRQLCVPNPDDVPVDDSPGPSQETVRRLGLRA